MDQQNPSSSHGAFPVTQWSLVGRAGHEREALAELLKRYLPAMRTHLVFQKRIPRDRADDLLQSFLAGKVLENNLIQRADKDRGKFRTFLLVALDNFVRNQVRNEAAEIRNPKGRVSLDEHVDPPDRAPRPEDTFDVAWGRAVLEQAVQRMREECKASDRPDIWGVFEARTLEPLLRGGEPVSYVELIKRFGFASPSQASNVLITAHRMFARLLRGVVGEYLPENADIDAEIADLREILSKSRAG